MFYNACEADVTLRSGKTHYLRFGTGKKVLVMVPGLRIAPIAGTAKAVALAFRIFVKDYTVYEFDRNEPVVEGCTIHSLAEDLAEAMEKLGLKDVYMYGASQGGMIAQDLAIHHPELVKKLVLAVTLSKNNETVEKVIESWIAMARGKGLGEIALDYTTKGFSESYLKKYKAILPLLMKMQKMVPKERFITLAKACLTCETYEQLDMIQCPVLVLGGAKDQIVTGEASREIAEKLNCPYYLYEELSHEAYSEAKDFNRRIYDFFAQS